MKNIKKNKMLPPTLKEKRHYLAIEILSKARLHFKQVKVFLNKTVRDFLGHETAKAGLQILELTHADEKYNLQVMQGILSVNRKYVLKIKAALSLLKEINNHQSAVRVLGVSGTLKKLREKFLS